ncbi:LuxR C-terminal-related transcriptional regulator [Polymorphospora rubra]|uniref:LuxR C-terminal-related transcriptional regulator n=1 Tax=Polymorphospora rubra TaxID=338584 RepID=UPI0034041505
MSISYSMARPSAVTELGQTVTDSVERDWPVLGRDAEIAYGERALAGPAGPGLVVTGEPGVGKSRLADLLLDRCAARGLLVLRGAATEATRHIPGVGVAGLRRPDAPGWLPAGGRLRDELPRDRPVVVGIDDADHLDDASAAVLADLGGVADVRLLLTTGRAAGPPAARTDVAGRPLRRLHLPSLSRAVTSELLGQVLGPVDGLTADLLWRATRGNPRLLRRMLDIGLETGGLTRAHGVWSWRGRLDDQPRVRDLASTDLGTFDSAEITALRYVALAGCLSERILVDLVGDDAVAAVTARGAVTRSDGPDVRRTVAMAHPLYRQLALAGLGQLRRRQMYRDLVRAAGRAGTRGVDAAGLVWWRLEADLPQRGPGPAVAAARALAAGAPVLAEDLARHVPGTRGVGLRAQALMAQGRPAETERLLGAVDRDTELAALRSLNLFWGLSRPADARAEVLRARAAAGGPAGDDLGVAELAVSLFTRGPSPAVDAAPGAAPPPGASPDPVASPAVAAPRPLNPLVADARTTMNAYLLTFRGRPARAAGRFADGSLTLPARWPAMRGSAAACHVHALILAGQLAEATRLADRYYAEAVRRGQPVEVAVVGHERGVCAMWAGRPAEALPALREARALIDEHTPFPVRVFVSCEYAVCVAALGRPDEAYRELDRGLAEIPDDLGLRDRLEFSQIRALAHSGRLAYAADLADRLADRYLDAARLTTAVECAYFQVRLRPSTRGAARLRAAAKECDSPLFDLFTDHAEALAAADPRALCRVADGFAERGYLGLAYEAAAAVPGGGRVSRDADRRLADLAGRYPGPHPPWAGGPGVADPLTAREREVCELAASGLTNAAIATALNISVRTVTNLLERAYHKLGIHRRRQLPAALSRSLIPVIRD